MSEIKRYRSALRQYKLSRYLPKCLFKTNFGFCYHFGMTTYEMDKYLPILYSLNPNYNMYWYKKGDIESRIELLKQAIEIYEKQRRTN